jgi:hypothetical protein
LHALSLAQSEQGLQRLRVQRRSRTLGDAFEQSLDERTSHLRSRGELCRHHERALRNCSEFAVDAKPASKYGSNRVVSVESTSFMTPSVSVSKTA